LAIGVHGARIRCCFQVERSVLSTKHGNALKIWKEIWKSGSKIWKAKKSGSVGWPPDPDFSQKVKKSALKKSGLAKSGIWNERFYYKR
jgi:hypothetical protein